MTYLKDLQSFLRSKFVRFIIVCIVIIVSIAIFANRHVRIGSFEINGQARIDTYFIVKKSSPDTVYLRETPLHTAIEKQKNAKPENKQEIHGKNINTGTNTGVIGDVTIGELPRRKIQPEDSVRLEFLLSVADPSQKIKVSSQMDDAEAYNYSLIVRNFLRSHGFKNYEGGSFFSISPPIKGINAGYDNSKILIVQIGSK
jgi:hypothetical protein